jgi:hypothetical protein|tara:strand:+ start:83 stop:691 length:609 start_codon:yes stop_codon:yes gene_type:complete
MASSIETTSTTTTLKNNGNTYLSVDTNDVVALTNPLPVASGGTGATSLALGKVLQVVSTTKTSTFSSATENAWTDITGMTVSITPSSSSSKVMVIASLSSGGGGNNYARGLLLVRDSTAICQADSGTGHEATSSVNKTQDQLMDSASITFLDSPSTTSATAYKIQFFSPTPSVTGFKLNTPHAADANSFNGASTITVMEIGA